MDAEAEPKGRSCWLLPLAGAVLLPALVCLLLEASVSGRTGRWVQAPLHSAMECACALLAFALAALLLFRRGYPGYPLHFDWVIASLVCKGLLDAIHSVQTVHAAFFWSRTLPTLLGGALISLVWLPQAAVPAWLRRRMPLLAGISVLPLCAALLLAQDAWPVMFDADGRYLPAAKALNYAGGAGYMAAAAFFIREYIRRDSEEDYVFYGYCLLFGTAAFLFGYSRMWGPAWWLFHFLRLAAYGMVLGYVVKLFADLRNGQENRSLSKLRSAEQALSESNARLKLVLEAAQMGTWDWEIRTGRILWSEEHEILLGYPPGTPLREFEDWRSRVHPEDLERAETSLRESMAGGREWRIQYRVIRRDDGRVRWLSARGRVLLDASGEPWRMIGVLWDVTETKLFEEGLKASQDQLRAILENIYDGIYVQDTGGKLVYGNESAARLLGYTSTEAFLRALESPAADILESYDRDGNRMDLQSYPGRRALRGEYVPPAPMRWKIRATGEEKWVLGGAKPIFDSKGEVTHAISFAHDITELRRVEEGLRRSQEMLFKSQRMESIGRLAGGVAHEFNNLLTTVNGYAELTLAALREDDPAHGFVQEIVQAGKRAADITRQLLAFGRRQILTPKYLDLNAHLKGMLDLLTHVVGEGIKVNLEPGPGLERIKVDPWQMEQVVLNLTLNARDAMPHGGTLTLKTLNEAKGPEGQEGSAAASGAWVSLTVSDTGHGMDPALMEKIFEPFFSTKGFGVSSGLGLSTVQGIVTQSGGAVTVESRLNEGTTFRILFPAASEAPKAPPPAPEPIEPLEGRSHVVLLAEDERGVRSLAASLLRSKGFTVLEAGDGEEALQAHRRHPGPIDLLVTDVIMPKMGGAALSKALLQERKGLRVLYMSGYTQEEHLDGLTFGARADFIPKPFQPAQFLAKIGQLLSPDPASSEPAR